MIQTLSIRVHDWWKTDFSSWKPGARLYGAGLAVLLLSFLASIVQLPTSVVEPIMALAAGLLMTGFVVEAYGLLAKWASQTWAKWLMVPLGAMVVAASLGGAAHVVGEATGQDPSYFPLAMSFLAPLAIIPVLALVGAIGLGLLGLGMMLSYMAGEALTPKTASSERGWVRVGRLMGNFCAVLALSTLIDASSPLSRMTTDAAGWAAQVLDMHKDTECGFGQHDRVKRINEGLVIRMYRTEDSTTRFVRQSCQLGPQVLGNASTG